MKMNRNKINQLLLILLGLIMLFSYIWFRFIRVRLPKEIPFIHLSFFSLITLSFMCFISIYYLTSLIIKKKIMLILSKDVY